VSIDFICDSLFSDLFIVLPAMVASNRIPVRVKSVSGSGESESSGSSSQSESSEESEEEDRPLKKRKVGVEKDLVEVVEGGSSQKRKRSEVVPKSREYDAKLEFREDRIRQMDREIVLTEDLRDMYSKRLAVLKKERKKLVDM
jgi:hypothetical protein